MSSSSGPTSVLHKKKNVAPHHADTGPVAAAKKELVGPGTIKQEFSDHGTGDFRSPSFQVSYEKDGSFVSPLTYKSHKIINGRLPMKVAHMPHIRSWAANKAEEADFGTTLVVTLVDSFTNLEVDLNYTVVHDHDVLLRSTVFRNPTRAQVLFDNSPNARNTHVGTATIHRAMSASLDFENERGGYQLTYLSGSWARERHVEHTRIQPGFSP